MLSVPGGGFARGKQWFQRREASKRYKYNGLADLTVLMPLKRQFTEPKRQLHGMLENSYKTKAKA